ncbi:hypothetical protein [Niabella beijingensis]|uniref:hypothetical protein n=1 Tax=Niabella beijingensis TaxID=2872700 RepID=UPI001CBCDB8A|nr:hypothetical protein [Niabella beijingensis]MBZ4188567.1 hypothetical protein [Niabella beijingensis]
MNTSSFLKEVYNHYPKGLTPLVDRQEYEEVYARRKRSVRALKEALGEQWEAFRQALAAGLTRYELNDRTDLFHNKFCYYLDCTSKEGRGLFKIHILLSVLMPWHSIVVTDFLGLNGTAMLDHDQFCLNNETKHRQYLETVKTINRLLGTFFNTRQVLFRELNKVPVPGAYLQTKKANVHLFDLVFTNYFTNF